jgi:multimeric flavodoxin WrbA
MSFKTLLVNGSPRKNGNTAAALSEIAKTLESEGIAVEIFWIGTAPVRGCAACGQCHARGNGRCVFDDDPANRLAEKLETADALVVGSPVYYGQPNGALLAALQRAFFADSSAVKGKPAAGVAVCRRGGATAAFQCLNLPFQMLDCPVVGSQYWNIAYGREPGEATLDLEGMQTMRTLARNLAWLLKTSTMTAPSLAPSPNPGPPPTSSADSRPALAPPGTIASPMAWALESQSLGF